ncbi:MAG: Ig-like domain-containing protein [Gemmatimonadaceae bacterium]
MNARLVTAVAPGGATITATSEGVEGTASITVEAVPVDSVAVTPTAATRHPGQTVQLTAALLDSAGGTLTGRVVSWASSDEALAVVDASGLVTAGAVGTVTITATSEGVDGTATITIVAVPVASVEINPDTAEIEIGDTFQFSAILRDSAGGSLARTVVWSSLDPAIATVDGAGFATAVAEGLARIVATSEGKADTARLSVTAPAQPGPAVVGPFNVHVTSSPEHSQGVATDGVTALYAMQTGSFGGGSNSLYVVRVDSTGAILGGPVPLNANGDPPALAYGGGTYLAAAWLPGGISTSRRTSAWLVAPDLSSIGSEIVLAAGDEAGAICGLAYGGGTFLATYLRSVGVNDNGDSLTALFGRAISPTGVLGGEIAVSPGFAACHTINNSAASDGTGFLAAWTVQDSATASDGVGVQARTISSGAVLGAVHSVRSTTVLGRFLSVAPRSTGGWVVGLGEIVDEVTGNVDAYLQPLAADGSTSGGLITLDETAAPMVVTVSEWEFGFVALTIERPGDVSTQVIRLRRYDASGAPTGVDLTLAGADGASKVPVSLSLTGTARIFVVAQFYTYLEGSGLEADEASGDVRGVWVRP